MHVSPEITQALADGTPVVALESALITHGFAPPANLEAVPAWVLPSASNSWSFTAAG